MTKTVRARTTDRAMSFVTSETNARCFNATQLHIADVVSSFKEVRQPNTCLAVSLTAARAIATLLSLPKKADVNVLKTAANVQYFDIDHLSRLAQEESYTMPRGLTREQRREWARKNLDK